MLVLLKFCVWILKLTENAEAEYNTYIVKYFKKIDIRKKL